MINKKEVLDINRENIEKLIGKENVKRILTEGKKKKKPRPEPEEDDEEQDDDDDFPDEDDGFPIHQVMVGDIKVSTRKTTMRECKLTIKELIRDENIKSYLNINKYKIPPEYIN